MDIDDDAGWLVSKNTAPQSTKPLQRKNTEPTQGQGQGLVPAVGTSSSAGGASSSSSANGAGAGASVPSQHGDNSRRNKQQRREEVRFVLCMVHGTYILSHPLYYPSRTAF